MVNHLRAVGYAVSPYVTDCFFNNSTCGKGNFKGINVQFLQAVLNQLDLTMVPHVVENATAAASALTTNIADIAVNMVPIDSDRLQRGLTFTNAVYSLKLGLITRVSKREIFAKFWIFKTFPPSVWVCMNLVAACVYMTIRLKTNRRVGMKIISSGLGQSTDAFVNAESWVCILYTAFEMPKYVLALGYSVMLFQYTVSNSVVSPELSNPAEAFESLSKDGKIVDAAQNCFEGFGRYFGKISSAYEEQWRKYASPQSIVCLDPKTQSVDVLPYISRTPQSFTFGSIARINVLHQFLDAPNVYVHEVAGNEIRNYGYLIRKDTVIPSLKDKLDRAISHLALLDLWEKLTKQMMNPKFRRRVRKTVSIKTETVGFEYTRPLLLWCAAMLCISTCIFISEMRCS